jgi:hypothetical protein
MTIKTLSAIFVLSAALSSTAIAQQARGPASEARNFQRSFNQTPFNETLNAPRAQGVWYWEGSSRDVSIPGGFDPDVRPAS